MSSVALGCLCGSTSASEPTRWPQRSSYHDWFHQALLGMWMYHQQKTENWKWHITSILLSCLSHVPNLGETKCKKTKRTGAIWDGLVYAQLRRHRYLWTVSSPSLIKVTTKLVLPVSHYVYTPRTTNCHCKSQTAYLWLLSSAKQCWLLLMIFCYFSRRHTDRFRHLELIWVRSAWLYIYFSSDTVLHTQSHLQLLLLP